MGEKSAKKWRKSLPKSAKKWRKSLPKSAKKWRKSSQISLKNVPLDPYFHGFDVQH